MSTDHFPGTGATRSLARMGATTFDLRALQPADLASKRGGLLYVAILTMAMVVEFFAIGWTTASAAVWGGVPLRDAWTNLLLLAGLGAAITFGVVGMRRLLPGAIRLDVDAWGVHLTYGHDRREDLSWEGGRRFVLSDYRDVPEMVEGARALSLRGPHFWGRRTLLTEEAFETILRFGRARETPVTVRTPGRRRARASA